MIGDEIFQIDKKFNNLNNQRIREQKKLAKQNIFSILRMEDFEIRHSNFLAWLFDSDCNGEIGNYCLKVFLKKLKNISDAFSNINLNIFFKNKYIVKREVKYKDILIESGESKKVIVIENKIYSSEHSNQLNRYYNDVMQDEKYAEYDKYFVYLTLGGEMPEQMEDRTTWVPFSYRQILEILQDLLNKKINKLSTNIQLLIQDYKEILEDKLEQSMNSIEEYRKLYDKYPGIVLEFKKYIPDNEKRLKIQREYINSLPHCKMASEGNNTYVDFFDTEIRELSLSRINKEDVVYFEFVNRGGWTITFRVIVNKYENDKSKEFIEKFKKHFSTNRLEKKDAAYKCFAMESILKIDKKSNLTEEEIHKLIRNNMEKLLDDKNSLYFQIVDFVKKEYFGV